MTEWRIGPEGGHTIYQDDRLIGIMLHPADAHLAVAQVNHYHSKIELMDAFKRMEHKIVTALEDLQAADVALGEVVTTLVDEQATFLTNVAAALVAAGTDPAALAAVAADITAQAQTLTSLVEAQRAADPGTPAV